MRFMTVPPARRVGVAAAGLPTGGAPEGGAECEAPEEGGPLLAGLRFCEGVRFELGMACSFDPSVFLAARIQRVVDVLVQCAQRGGHVEHAAAAAFDTAAPEGTRGAAQHVDR